MRMLYPLVALLFAVTVTGCRNPPPPQPPPPTGGVRVVAPGVNVNVVDPPPPPGGYRP